MQGIGQHRLGMRRVPGGNGFAGFPGDGILLHPALQSGKRDVEVVDEAKCILQAGDRLGVLHHLGVVEQGGKKLARVAQVLQGDPEAMGALRRWRLERSGQAFHGPAVQARQLLFGEPGQVFREVVGIQIVQVTSEEQNRAAVA